MENFVFDHAFNWLEENRWDLNHDIAWQSIQHDLVSADYLDVLRTVCIAEFTSLEASRVFLRDYYRDIDFGCFVSIWYYEEMKHHYVLRRYLQEYGIEIDQKLLKSVHSETSAGSITSTLALHMFGEIKLHNWYIRTHQVIQEPVLKHIFRLIAADELRHGKVYFTFLQRRLEMDRSELPTILRVGRFVNRGSDGKSKHPVPQLVKGSDEFNFGEEMERAFEVIGMHDANKKAEVMSYEWLSRLAGIKIRDLESLNHAIRHGRSTVHVEDKVSYNNSMME